MNFFTRIFKKKPKIIVIAGPTATGKSDLAVELAIKYNGEIISADSRQVYKGLDIGSAKISQEEMKGIPHHLLDIIDPMDIYSVADYQRDASIALNDILARKKLPIICGGTGFYIDSLLYESSFPAVPPNPSFRTTLETYSTEKLFELLKEKDMKRASTIDQYNRPRIIRALEIAEVHGYVPKQKKQSSPYQVLYCALYLEKEEHYSIIQKRIDTRMKHGMLEEIASLHRKGVTTERFESLGLEYRYLARVFNGTMQKEEALELLYKETIKYVKRQYTWFKKHPKLHWFHTTREREQLFKKVDSFLS